MSKIKRNNIFQFLALGFLLIVLPWGSWYYLKKGFNYRLEALQELAEKGPLPIAGTIYSSGEPLTVDHLNGKVVVSSFYTLQEANKKEKIGKLQASLYKQFGKRADILLLNYIVGQEGMPNDNIAAFQETYSLSDTARILFISLPEEALKKHLLQGYQFSEEAVSNLKEVPLFALTDIHQQIRHLYHFNEEEIIKLIEHTAIVFPRAAEKDILLKRDREK